MCSRFTRTERSSIERFSGRVTVGSIALVDFGAVRREQAGDLLEIRIAERGRGVLHDGEAARALVNRRCGVAVVDASVSPSGSVPGSLPS